ncbi:MAG: acyltransferase domain-containing protein, partial [Chloroflexota bacterium]
SRACLVPEGAAAPAAEPAEAPRLFCFSARSEPALREVARRARERLPALAERDLVDLAYTLSLRRTHHDCRLAATAGSREELARALDSFLHGEPLPNVSRGDRDVSGVQRVAFVFAGQGGQWPGMGRDLFATQPVFRDAIQRCEAAFRPFVDWRLTEYFNEILGNGAGGQGEWERIDRAQPLHFALQVALAELWQSWGVLPAAVVGHSMGEVAAAHIAGALSLDDAARVICTRSRLLARIAGAGGMALVELSAAEAAQQIEPWRDRLAIAAINGPTSTVVSGDSAAIGELLGRLEAADVFCRRINVDVASHSPQVEPLCAELHRELADLRGAVPAVPIYSTVEAAPWDRFDAAYWAANLRRPVQFAGACRQITRSGPAAFLELSPHPLLLNALQETVPMGLGSLRRDTPGMAVLLESLGTLYCLGYPVRWSALYPEGGNVLPLPPYPWQRQRFWPGRALAAEEAASEPEEPESLADHLYQIRWQKHDPPEPVSTSLADEVWMVVVDAGATDETGQAVARRVRELGGVAILTEAPGLDGQRHALQQATRIVYLRRGSLAELVRLVQELARHPALPHRLLWLVTRGAQAVPGDDRLRAVDGLPAADGAPLWGLARTLAAEHGDLWGGVVDLPAERDPAHDARAIVAAVISAGDEAGHEAGHESEMAIRAGDVYVPRLEKRTLGHASGRITFDPHSSYLITGGLGDLGVRLAAWMVGRGARHLILLSRTGLPDRRIWPDVKPDSATGRRIRVVEALARAGATCACPAADVADRAHLAGVLEQITRGGHLPLRGVIHAAGVVEPSLIADLDAESIERMLRPKMGGAMLLDELLASTPLDFFVLFSSFAAWLASPRLAAYAAANAGLDALAQRRRAQGRPALCVNWGFWAETGMAARSGWSMPHAQ